MTPKQALQNLIAASERAPLTWPEQQARLQSAQMLTRMIDEIEARLSKTEAAPPKRK